MTKYSTDGALVPLQKDETVHRNVKFKEKAKHDASNTDSLNNACWLASSMSNCKLVLGTTLEASSCGSYARETQGWHRQVLHQQGRAAHM